MTRACGGAAAAAVDLLSLLLALLASFPALVTLRLLLCLRRANTPCKRTTRNNHVSTDPRQRAAAATGGHGRKALTAPPVAIRRQRWAKLGGHLTTN